MRDVPIFIFGQACDGSAVLENFQQLRVLDIRAVAHVNVFGRAQQSAILDVTAKFRRDVDGARVQQRYLIPDVIVADGFDRWILSHVSYEKLRDSAKQLI